jgi:hypothetical protein
MAGFADIVTTKTCLFAATQLFQAVSTVRRLSAHFGIFRKFAYLISR